MFRLVSCCSFYFSDIGWPIANRPQDAILDAILPYIARRRVPLLSVLILWVANPKGISGARRDNERITARTSVLDCRSAFPASSVTNTEIVAELRTATRPHPYWGSEEGEFRTRGTRFSEFPGKGSRWQTRDVLTDGACWSSAPVRLGGETFSEFPAMSPRRTVSDFLLQ